MHMLWLWLTENVTFFPYRGVGILMNSVILPQQLVSYVLFHVQHLPLILQSFDWLAAFHLELLQAILSIAV